MEWPKSPKELLEARYQAFIRGDIDFIVESHHPELRSQLDRDSLVSWSRESEWKGLKIFEMEEKENRAFLDFSVRYQRNFEVIDHRERAEFRKDDGRWFYYDSEFVKPESVRRDGEKIGRNDPCSCGSGKKFKKCCGAVSASGR